MNPIRLDSGKFPQMNYNRTIRKAKRAIRSDCGTRCDVMTARRALSIWRVVQDVNSVREPQLALPGRKRFI